MRPDLLPNTFNGKVARLVEEMGEVMQEIGKMGRFGQHAIDPITKIKYDNLKKFRDELFDLASAIKAFDIDFYQHDRAVYQERERLEKK